MDALAVVTAIELRPENERTPEPITPPKTETPKAPNRQAEAPLRPAFLGKSSWGSDEVAVDPGTLRFKSLLNWTVSLGAAVGPFPPVVFPRYEMASRFANAVTTPEGTQRINGPILRARVAMMGPPLFTYRAADTATEFNPGAAIGLAACWSPHYDSSGLVLLGCADFGIGQLGLTRIEPDGTRASPKVMWFGTGGPLLELEYNFGAFFHLAANAGFDLIAFFHLAANAGFDLIAGDYTAERVDGFEAWLPIEPRGR